MNGMYSIHHYRYWYFCNAGENLFDLSEEDLATFKLLINEVTRL